MTELKELNIKIVQILALKEQIKTLGEHLDLVKSEIKAELADNHITNYEDLVGNKVLLRATERKSLNRQLVEQKLAPDVFNECFKISKFETLIVTSKEDIDKKNKK